jgi:competence protein ComEC
MVLATNLREAAAKRDGGVLGARSTAPSVLVGERRLEVWTAPLLPLVPAVAAGIILDHFFSIAFWYSFAAALLAVAAWIVTAATTQSRLRITCLSLASGALAATYHHWYREIYAPDDIGNYATAVQEPARLRGILLEEPYVKAGRMQDALTSIPRTDSTMATLQVTALRQRNTWAPASGRARLVIEEGLSDVHVGDLIELVGRLQRPHGAANPGEADYAASLQDHRIRAIIQVAKTTDAVVLQEERWRSSFFGLLAVMRNWAQHCLEHALSAQQRDVAAAMLLGEDSMMSNDEWERYVKTGVVHVLAISGMHMVILTGFLWGISRLLGLRQRQTALVIALLVMGYALLTGGRPPILRAAVTVCVICLGIMVRRYSVPANTLALSWLIVLMINPTDMFTAGCQLSFLAVLVLYWGAGRWFNRPIDPLRRLIEESRGPVERSVRWLGKKVMLSYAVTAVVWLTAAPLVASHYHLISFSGLVIGPPSILLMAVALISGFLVLMFSAVGFPLAEPFAWIMHWSISGCQQLVQWAERIPGNFWYLANVPNWWLAIFYGGLIAFLVSGSWRPRWQPAALAGLSWLGVGLLASCFHANPAGLRCTFLAVGHGGCTVMETGDGRVLLYDAGALEGPEVTRRQLAPFLWHRGIRRLDEVFLSHADLDHFNGLLGLVDRFSVGLVTCTPTFGEKPVEGVRMTLEELAKRRIPIRVVSAGDRLSAGDLTADVIHPPIRGPEGNENARSLVLLVRHAGHRILLTGDLEGLGLSRVLSLPATAVDVLQAPHHGSPASNKPALATWAQPKLVISCQGPPRYAAAVSDPYSPSGAVFWSTWPHGAVTVLSRHGALTAETFATGQRVHWETNLEPR